MRDAGLFAIAESSFLMYLSCAARAGKKGGGGAMLNPAEEEQVRTVIRTHWLIYFSFTTAVLMYTFVVFVITQGGEPQQMQVGMMRQIFLIVSVVAGIVKFWVQSRYLSDDASYRTCRNREEILAKYWRYNYIMLALAELPALLGLVITFVTMRLQEWWVFLAISALLLATSAPSAGRLRRIIETHSIHQQPVS